jgi:hypothetical protein
MFVVLTVSLATIAMYSFFIRNLDTFSCGTVAVATVVGARAGPIDDDVVVVVNSACR